MRKLIPRLNYDFGFIKLIIGFVGLFRNTIKNQAIEDFFENKNVYFTNQARTGLRVLLNSIGLKKGDYIGVQAFNCNTVFNAINKAGFNIVYIDINENLTIDINDLKQKAPQINALIVTHTFGIPAEIDLIRDIVGNKIIIEDCAHSFLSKKNQTLTGRFGDAAIFSIGNAKFPSIGEGGIVVLNNALIKPTFEEQYSHLLQFPFRKEFLFLIKNFLFSFSHIPFIYGTITNPFLKKLDKKTDFGGKYKFEEFLIMRSFKYLFFYRLNTLKMLCEKQRVNAKKILAEIPQKLISIREPENDVFNYFMIPLQIEAPDEFIKFFNYNGIETGFHFSKSIEWAKMFGYINGACPNAEKVVKTLVVVPCHYNLKENEVRKIAKIFQTYKSEHTY